MRLKSAILALIIAVTATLAFSQDLYQPDASAVQQNQPGMYLRHSIGSSLFLLGNFASGDPVYFGQLNYGYLLTPRDNLVVEAKTWTYYEPLGTYGDSEEMYPGKVRALGIGVGYQRFLWKKAYASVVATPFLQQFYAANNQEIQKGMQLYLEFILGYRLEFWHQRWFAEPAIALKYWPVNTNFPADFAAIEAGSPDYKFEPSANFGYRFGSD